MTMMGMRKQSILRTARAATASSMAWACSPTTAMAASLSDMAAARCLQMEGIKTACGFLVLVYMLWVYLPIWDSRV